MRSTSAPRTCRSPPASPCATCGGRNGPRRASWPLRTRCDVEPAADTLLAQPGIVGELRARFPDVPLVEQRTADEIPTVWAPATRLKELLAYLKTEAARPFASLYDLGGIDERPRGGRAGVHRCRRGRTDWRTAGPPRS